MSDYIPMSRAGYEKLKAELSALEDVEMPKIAKRIAEARAEGDLKENAEYHGARESQGMLQAKINMLRDKLGRAQIVDSAAMPKDQVAFGSTVVVKDLDFGDNETFTLVGADLRAARLWEADLVAARMTRADLRRAKLHKAKIDDTT